VGGWIRLHDEELHNLYALPNIVRVIRSRRMRQAGHATCMGEVRNACKIMAGRSRHRWEDNMEVEWVSVDWIHLTDFQVFNFAKFSNDLLALLILIYFPVFWW
jgi:hypothetical protein